MANVKNNSAAQETRRRLLAAAGAVFAERGFHAATIKDITDRAQASLASVNYHFQDKAELYAAVLRRIEEDALAILPPPGSLVGSPADRLRQLIAHLCDTMICYDRPAWEQVLMAREVAEPSAAMFSIIDHVLRPLNDQMSVIVAELLKVSPDERTVGLHVASIVGQILHHSKRHKLIGRIHPQLGEAPELSGLAEHIAEFSLAGLGVASLSSRKQREARRSRSSHRRRPAQLS